MGSISDFENLQSAITESLVATTRSATRLAAEDVPFLRSSDLSVAKALDDKSARLLALAEKLIQRSSDAPAPRRTRLSDADEVNANWRSVVDSIDSLLERADTALDEFKGYFKSKAQDGRTDVRLGASNHASKDQYEFHVNNDAGLHDRTSLAGVASFPKSRPAKTSTRFRTSAFQSREASLCAIALQQAPCKVPPR